MTQELVGYQLVDQANNVIQSWGGTWGQCPGEPNLIVLPNETNDQIHSPQLDTDYSGYKLIKWMMDAPTDPNYYTLKPYQFYAMVAIANLTSVMEASVASIPDPIQRIIAQSKIDHTTLFVRSDPLINQLGAAANLTPQQIDAYWMQAKDL